MKFLSASIISIILFFFSALNALALYNPLSVPNNKVGVHILFPDEVFEARDLVNSQGGNWGYVTIPIQASDKNLEKWQTFMNDCFGLHLIPILRLATNGDYFNTKVWEKPKPEDILDFANFLNSLDWPTKNRYVIVYNEVNRDDEWGGKLSPKEYAKILNYATDTFKSKNSDFFILSAGLDNAAPNLPGYMNEYDFLKQMELEVPGIFSKIDGIASHSYPNPGFSQPPLLNTTESVYSFKYESSLVQNMGGKNLPVFITETGWSDKSLSQTQIANYMKTAFKNVWNDSNVVAVTPFLLRAQGDFSEFSLIDSDGQKNERYKALIGLPKTAGEPILNNKVKSNPLREITLPIRRFLYTENDENPIFSIVNPTKKILKWLLQI